MSHTLAALTEAAFAAELAAIGLSEEAAAEKQKLFAAAAQLIIDNGVAADARASALWVPGRIEVVGKHTDYAGGRSLLGAVNKGFCVVTVDRDDAVCKIYTTFSNGESKTAVVEMHPDLDPSKGESWVNYPATAIRRLVRNFGIDKGLEIAIGCDIPGASGMSTSSAIICYMFMALARRNNLYENPKFKKNLPTNEELYGYLGFIENGQNCGEELVGDKGVGTFGGSEDHTAIMSGERMALKMFSYCPTRFEGAFKFPENTTFVIASSGSVAEKTGDKMDDYNNAALIARDGAVAYNDAKGTRCANLAEVIAHARQEAGTHDVKQAIIDVLTPLDNGTVYPKVEGKRKYAAGALVRRFIQFYIENEEVVAQVAKAFDAADFEALGRLVDISQEYTDTHLQNIIPCTRWLPKKAREIGAIAASAFGAGFGGSVWALIENDRADEFMAAWHSSYVAEFPENKELALFFKMRPGPGATFL